MTALITRHETVRLTLPVGDARAFQARFEKAVPQLPADLVATRLREGAGWDELAALVNDAGPYGFVRYTDLKPEGVMALKGHDNVCVGYLMGNHTIAERMYRHTPETMLYAPLRLLIWSDVSGDGFFSIDVPSAQFGSFGIDTVTEVGAHLDERVENLLEALGVLRGATLRDIISGASTL